MTDPESTEAEKAFAELFNRTFFGAPATGTLADSVRQALLDHAKNEEDTNR